MIKKIESSKKYLAVISAKISTRQHGKILHSKKERVRKNDSYRQKAKSKSHYPRQKVDR